ncbi:hypothetical protein CEUSTIGMA_g9786.t1 [Chlamydomonas eustigma]|uniref:Sucrose phosphatase-like domain-containing protein n=1 Tax=Chlamydomonas eustigma TaxID=1157962 RepID=A0A250XH03_9CHLO|nr:hypothetical protein CEUSTIGMA_g9786.t1 [Chlamydomonas eustigma]|eukprot:GAX82357.1 hypothetical protein CEUSTIGMA_g9786.t1 [Chlamydomonas eustigma]
MKVIHPVMDTISNFLVTRGIKVNIIVSWHGENRVLDIVPACAGKYGAMEHVRQGLGFPVERTVSCGDAGNDILMLSGPHHTSVSHQAYQTSLCHQAYGSNPSIIVANAQPDLLDWCRNHHAAALSQTIAAAAVPSVARGEDVVSVFNDITDMQCHNQTATSGRLFMATKAEADGIVEGLQHFFGLNYSIF